MLHVCVSREFFVLVRRRTSRVVEWVRRLGNKLNDECPGPGIGVVTIVRPYRCLYRWVSCRTPFTIILATRSPKGRPMAAPVWPTTFYIEGQETDQP